MNLDWWATAHLPATSTLLAFLSVQPMRSNNSILATLLSLSALGSSAIGVEPAQTTTTPPPPSVARVADPRDVRARFGLSPAYDDLARVDSIKVAVLDYGFEGMGRGRAYLPEGAVV